MYHRWTRRRGSFPRCHTDQVARVRAPSRLKQAGVVFLLAVPVAGLLLVGLLGGLLWGLRGFLLLFGTSEEYQRASARLGDGIFTAFLATAVGASAYYAVLSGIWLVIRRARTSA